MQNDLSLIDATSEPLPIFSFNGALPDFLGNSWEAGLGTNVMGMSDATDPPKSPLIFPFPINQQPFLIQQSPAKCTCVKAQIECIAELCAQLDFETMQLDAILETARKTGNAARQYISCHLCQKTSLGCLLITIAVQRMVLTFCHAARHGPQYVQQTRLSLGRFTVSEDEDRIHKQMLIVAAVRRVDGVLLDLEKAVHDCHRQNAELGPHTARSNLQWVMETLKIIKRWMTPIMRLTQSDDWGLQHFSLRECPLDAMEQNKSAI